MESGISRDEWLQALAEAGLHEPNDPTAVTIEEFGAMFGLKRETARRRLEQLEAAGRAVQTRKRMPRPDGQMCSYRAFRLVPKVGTTVPKTGTKKR